MNGKELPTIAVVVQKFRCPRNLKKGAQRYWLLLLGVRRSAPSVRLGAPLQPGRTRTLSRCAARCRPDGLMQALLLQPHVDCTATESMDMCLMFSCCCCAESFFAACVTVYTQTRRVALPATLPMTCSDNFHSPSRRLSIICPAWVACVLDSLHCLCDCRHAGTCIFRSTLRPQLLENAACSISRRSCCLDACAVDSPSLSV